MWSRISAFINSQIVSISPFFHLKSFGNVRTKEIIRKNENLSAHEIIDTVYSDLNYFMQGFKQIDDITLVVINLKTKV